MDLFLCVFRQYLAYQIAPFVYGPAFYFFLYVPDDLTGRSLVPFLTEGKAPADWREEIHWMNIQTRLLSGYAELSQVDPPLDPLPDDALERAKENLENRNL